MAEIETFMQLDAARPFRTSSLGVTALTVRDVLPEIGTSTTIIYGNIVSGQTVYTNGAPQSGATYSWIVDKV